MDQQNIIFVFMQVPKLAMVITVKVKDITQMQVRKMPALFVFAFVLSNQFHIFLWFISENITSFLRYLRAEIFT